MMHQRRERDRDYCQYTNDIIKSTSIPVLTVHVFHPSTPTDNCPPPPPSTVIRHYLLVTTLLAWDRLMTSASIRLVHLSDVFQQASVPDSLTTWRYGKTIQDRDLPFM